MDDPEKSILRRVILVKTFDKAWSLLMMLSFSLLAFITGVLLHMKLSENFVTEFF